MRLSFRVFVVCSWAFPNHTELSSNIFPASVVVDSVTT